MAAQVALSPRIKKSPFFEATQRHGASAYSVYNKRYLPFGYGDPMGEYWGLVNDVALWDVFVQKVVEISGPDGFAFADMLTPRDLSKCKVGQCKYVVLTNEQGGILNDPVLMRLDENTFWLSLADSDMLMWAKGVAINSGLDVNISVPDICTAQIQGPKSVHVVEKLFGSQVLDIPYYGFMELELEGSPVLLARTGWSAERGYEVYVRDTSKAMAIWDAILEAGQEHDIVIGSPNRVRRVEGGILDYNVDMSEETTPLHVGLDRITALDTGRDFIGKEALIKLRDEGVTKHIAGVFLEGAEMGYNEEDWNVTKDGKSVGKLTTYAYSPRLEKNMGIVMIDKELCEIGETMTVETQDGPRTATVTKMPFTDPNKDLAKK